MLSSKCIKFAVSLVGFVISVPFAFAAQREPVDAQRATIQLRQLENQVTLAAWKVKDHRATVAALNTPESSLRVTAGDGCLILVRGESAPLTYMLNLEPGRATSIDPSGWEKGVTISGTVHSEYGEPLVAEAELVPSTQNHSEPAIELCTQALLEAGIAKTVADETGTFSLHNVPAGTFELTLRAKNRESKSMKVAVSNEYAIRDVGEVVLREVAKLILSFDLSEVDSEYPFDVVVQRENPDPFLDQRDEWKSLSQMDLRDTAPLSFVLAPGMYRIVFSKEESDLFYVEQLFLSPGINEYELRPRPITVFGDVTDKKGKIADAEILLSCSGHHNTVRSDEDGYFEARLWNAVVCAILVSTPDGRRHPVTLDLRDVDFGDRFEFPISVSDVVVAGEVVDADTGEPIQGASVSMRQTRQGSNERSMLGTKTDAEGRFEFKGARGSNAETLLMASADDYLPGRVEVFLADQQDPPDVRLELHEAVGIKGRVVGPAGEPVQGAVVGCCAGGPDDFLSVSTETDSDGLFAIDTAPGALIFVAAHGYAIGWSPAQEDDFIIRLGPRAHVTRMSIVDQEGHPVPRVVITLSAPDSGIIPYGVLDRDAVLNMQQIRTGQDGTLVTASFPAGLYKAWLLTRGVPIDVGVVLVPSDGENELHVP